MKVPFEVIAPMKKTLLMWFAVVFCVAISSPAAFGCACCAEPGTYSIWTGRPDNYYSGILNDIKLGPKTALFMTEAGFDGVKGLSAIRKEYDSDAWTASSGEFNLTNSFSKKTWHFVFKSMGGKSGTLVLPMPAKMLIFKVDIHDNSDTGNGPMLYKEIRFQGNVSSGTGFLKSGIAPSTSYFLVFQGRGNGCDNASDFTHWRLEITGSKASYAFFGTTVSGNKDEKEARAEILQ